MSASDSFSLFLFFLLLYLLNVLIITIEYQYVVYSEIQSCVFVWPVSEFFHYDDGVVHGHIILSLFIFSFIYLFHCNNYLTIIIINYLFIWGAEVIQKPYLSFSTLIYRKCVFAWVNMHLLALCMCVCLLVR